MATNMVPVVNEVRGKSLLWTSLVALLLTSAVMTGTVMPSDSASVYVDPPLVEDICPDDPDPTFTVDIKVDVGVGVGVPTLYGWDFTLSFNPGLLQVTNVTMGLFLFEETGWETAWQWGFVTPAVDNFDGFVSAGDVIMADEWTGELPGVGASGTGRVLATIEFEVIGYGVCFLD
ncbi:MAG: hypothetical protein HWN68_16280, partial [Desulfobacterales bacterium]|nr:hypothetical protein [Desulfobacterales bacterium]